MVRFESPAIWAGFVADAAPWRDGPGPGLIGALESRARKCPRFGAGRTRHPRSLDQTAPDRARRAPGLAFVGRSGANCGQIPRSFALPGASRKAWTGTGRTRRGRDAILGFIVGRAPVSPHCRPLAGRDGSATLIRPCVGPGQCRRQPSAPAQASAGTGARRRSRTAAGTTPANEIMAVTHQAWRKASR